MGPKVGGLQQKQHQPPPMDSSANNLSSGWGSTSTPEADASSGWGQSASTNSGTGAAAAGGWPQQQQPQQGGSGWPQQQAQSSTNGGWGGAPAEAASSLTDPVQAQQQEVPKATAGGWGETLQPAAPGGAWGQAAAPASVVPEDQQGTNSWGQKEDAAQSTAPGGAGAVGAGVWGKAGGAAIISPPVPQPQQHQQPSPEDKEYTENANTVTPSPWPQLSSPRSVEDQAQQQASSAVEPPAPAAGASSQALQALEVPGQGQDPQPQPQSQPAQASWPQIPNDRPTAARTGGRGRPTAAEMSSYEMGGNGVGVIGGGAGVDSETEVQQQGPPGVGAAGQEVEGNKRELQLPPPQGETPEPPDPVTPDQASPSGGPYLGGSGWDSMGSAGGPGSLEGAAGAASGFHFGSFGAALGGEEVSVQSSPQKAANSGANQWDAAAGAPIGSSWPASASSQQKPDEAEKPADSQPLASNDRSDPIQQPPSDPAIAVSIPQAPQQQSQTSSVPDTQQQQPPAPHPVQSQQQPQQQSPLQQQQQQQQQQSASKPQGSSGHGPPPGLPSLAGMQNVHEIEAEMDRAAAGVVGSQVQTQDSSASQVEEGANAAVPTEVNQGSSSAAMMSMKQSEQQTSPYDSYTQQASAYAQQQAAFQQYGTQGVQQPVSSSEQFSSYSQQSEIATASLSYGLPSSSQDLVSSSAGYSSQQEPTAPATSFAPTSSLPAASPSLPPTSQAQQAGSPSVSPYQQPQQALQQHHQQQPHQQGMLSSQAGASQTQPPPPLSAQAQTQSQQYPPGPPPPPGVAGVNPYAAAGYPAQYVSAANLQAYYAQNAAAMYAGAYAQSQVPSALYGAGAAAAAGGAAATANHGIYHHAHAAAQAQAQVQAQAAQQAQVGALQHTQAGAGGQHGAQAANTAGLAHAQQHAGAHSHSAPTHAHGTPAAGAPHRAGATYMDMYGQMQMQGLDAASYAANGQYATHDSYLGQTHGATASSGSGDKTSQAGAVGSMGLYDPQAALLSSQQGLYSQSAADPNRASTGGWAAAAHQYTHGAATAQQWSQLLAAGQRGTPTAAANMHYAQAHTHTGSQQPQMQGQLFQQYSNHGGVSSSSDGRGAWGR